MEMQMDEISDRFLHFVEDVFVNEPQPPGLIFFSDSKISSAYPYEFRIGLILPAIRMQIFVLIKATRQIKRS